MDTAEPVRADHVWRTIALLCLIGLAVFAGQLLLPGQMCPVPDNLLTDEQLKLIVPKPDGRGMLRPNCFEFWVNRYQAFIGSIIALGAAIIAVIPARGQLKQMLRQTSASARQPMIDLAKALEDEIDFLHRLQSYASKVRELIEIYDEAHPEDVGQMVGDLIQASLRAIDEGLLEYRAIEARHPIFSATSEARLEFIEATIDLEVALQNFDLAFRSGLDQIDEGSGETRMSPKEIQTSRREIVMTRIAWSKSNRELRKLLVMDLRSAWTQVRTLEKQVLAT
ncbi:hypothetical protein [Methylobacterium sp. C1]|uniref:hypothetical protein n=1 Tax=Methylobacterium sp. C1 TaxID=1479019 RepID=UPI0013312A96|nr:hypothetical protein [Methylobacterium sp. C1]